jgi:hypothetical protein
MFFNLQGIAKAVFGDWRLKCCSFEAWRVILLVIGIFGGSPAMLITTSIRVYSGTAKMQLAGPKCLSQTAQVLRSGLPLACFVLA